MLISELSELYNIDFGISENNVTIYNSYRIKRKSLIKHIIKSFKQEYPNHNVSKISTFLLVNEWATHNLFYNLGIYRNRTKDTDLNVGKKWYINIVYSIIGLFYF